MCANLKDYDDNVDGILDGIDEDEYDEDQKDIDEDDLEAELFEQGYNMEPEYNDEYYYEIDDDDEVEYYDDKSKCGDIKDIITEDIKDIITEKGLSILKSNTKLPNLTEKGLSILKSNMKLPNLMTFYLFDYIPGRFEQDQNSKDIILIKRNNFETIDKFVNILLNILNKDGIFIICVVPSANSNAGDTGVSNIAKKLCQKNPGTWIDGTSLIKRKKDIPIKHLRERYPYYDEEYDSLEIVDSGEIIKEGNILLLDDIITKGQAISVVRRKLLENGANMVVSITLGKTIFRKPD